MKKAIPTTKVANKCLHITEKQLFTPPPQNLNYRKKSLWFATWVFKLVVLFTAKSSRIIKY